MIILFILGILFIIFGLQYSAVLILIGLFFLFLVGRLTVIEVHEKNFEKFFGFMPNKSSPLFVEDKKRVDAILKEERQKLAAAFKEAEGEIERKKYALCREKYSTQKLRVEKMEQAAMRSGYLP